MRRFIFLIFIGTFLTKNVEGFSLTKIHRYPSNLAWLFGLNDKLNETKEEARTVCQNQECKKMANVILESMNKSVDPCDDFYEYACGRFPEHNPIPEEELEWSLFSSLQENVQRQMEDILNAKLEENDLFAMKIAKKWYMSCMDTDTIEKQGLQPLVFTLSRIGGWPMIMDPDEWDEQEYSWQKVDDQYMRLTGRNSFHDVRVYEYLENVTNAIKITIHMGTPHLPPGSHKLYESISEEVDEEEKSDEDPSDEEKHSDEQENSREPGSDGEDDSKGGVDDHDGDDHDNDDNDEDNEIDIDDTNEEDDDENTQKKVDKKKAGKIDHRKNRKLGHKKRKKSGTRIIKKNNGHQAKKQRIKRRGIPKKVESKRTQRVNHREKLRTRKNKRNHIKKIHRERRKKTLDDMEARSTTPRVTTEETNDETAAEMPKQYAEYILSVARAIAKARGAEVSEKHILKDIEDMIEFQIKLTAIAMESVEVLMLTLDDFQEWYNGKNPETANSEVNWVYKIWEMFDEAHVPMDDDLNIEVVSQHYFEALISLLDETPSRTIVNYIHWNFISRILKATTKETKEMYDTWEKTEEDESRSAHCLKEVKITDILAYEYVRRYFSDDIRETALDMLDDIQKEVEYQIKESDWMDEDTKDFVLAKLVKMQKLIGYPNWYTNTTMVKRYFQGLVIGKSYYENTLSYERYTKWKSLRTLTRTKIDMEILLEVNPAEVNAFYSPQINFLSITAADFQSPFFAYNRPQAINFGIIGFMMAHEVNHGFDDTGHLYNKNGAYTGWLSAMAQAYNKRAECFVEQFNNYPIDKASNKKIPNYGNQTTGDNIADTMGLQAVFRAYQRRERECGKPDIVLPGLEDMTNDQIFFLSFATLWCETVNPTYRMMLARMDEHSTGPLRVIGSVSNSEDFAKAYNCPSGSPMNPKKKCSIWK